VNVGPFVIPDAQPAKLIEPRKRPFDHPPPPPEATAVFRAAPGKPGQDVTRPEAPPNRRRVVAAIPEHAVRPLPGAPACALQRGNRIYQGQGFLRVVPVGSR
jgi:hypothetical protein